jgi:hypothetical protein
MADPKIEKIMAELTRRLKLKYPRVPIQRGFFGDEVTTYPSIYLMEDEEVSTLESHKKRGMYVRQARIGISFFLKGPTNPTEVYEKANKELYDLYGAVELDEHFADSDSTLVLNYGVENTVKLFYKSNVIQLAVTYVFAYSEFAPWASKTRRRN